jgi:cobalt-zinc-cadmium efflux system protein
MALHHHSTPERTGIPAARRLGAALLITLVFVGVEIAAGLLGNSLALLSDAAHNVTDVIALGLSWYAARLSTQAAHAGRTYGYHRAGILAALANSTTLILVALGIFYESYRRFVAPPEVDAAVLTGVGALAFGVNLLTAGLVRHGSERDLNLRSAFVHLMGDVFSTLGAVAAGLLIAATGFYRLDPLVSALIGVLILWNAWGILRETVEILLEGTPRDIDMDSLVADLRAVDGVRGIHDLHVWSLSRSARALSAHILTDDISLRDGACVQLRINEILCRKYDIRHATLQLEVTGCEPDTLYCGMNGSGHAH